MDSLISFRQLEKVYRSPAGEFRAIQPMNLEIAEGSFLGVLGHSGCGKSTLLNLISGIERPSAGMIRVSDRELGSFSESKLAEFRGRHIGIVFQFFQLIPNLNLLENIRLPMDLVGKIAKKERDARAKALLDQVGIGRHAGKLPAQISGGEQQRVAIARALANDPPIVIADEPTGNLDSENSAQIRTIFRTFAASGRTVIMATHERSQLHQFSRVLELVDGRVAEDSNA